MTTLDDPLSDDDLEKFLQEVGAYDSISTSESTECSTSSFDKFFDMPPSLPPLNPSSLGGMEKKRRSLFSVGVVVGVLSAFVLGALVGFFLGKERRLAPQIKRLSKQIEAFSEIMGESQVEEEIIEPIEKPTEEEQLAPKSPA